MNSEKREKNSAAEPPEKLANLKQGSVKTKAVGSAAIISSFQHLKNQAGAVAGSRAIMSMNQKEGFDCPSCAWPDPEGERSKFEFCENGAKALASEMTRKRADGEFFARYSVDELSEQSDYWLNEAGRLSEPMILEEGATHYRRISWESAFSRIAAELKDVNDPDEAVFYTSGRTSNEAAFLYQLFVRKYGTNNLPDCSNMCHESSGAALTRTLGIGKGTVTLEEIETTDCVLILGQNPGTNHPRMLTSLEKTVRNGGKILAVNPLPETGLMAFSHPQKVFGLLGGATPLASQFLQIKLNGDLAFLKGMIKCVFEAEQKNPGEIINAGFISDFAMGYAQLLAENAEVSWKTITEQSGLTEAEIRKAAETFIAAPESITCWAMGLTQHKNAVATIQEVVNLHLLLGRIGRLGSGVCPVRGHSNVQGDRTMGIWEKMPDAFLDRLEETFSFHAPREPGFDTVAAIEAMHAGKVRVFMGMGGNFLSASPDTLYTAAALSRCELTVHVATKLNRGHLVTGRCGLILPCLGRSERDMQESGEQFVSVENSMGIVHSSKGTLKPASASLLSEVDIVCRLAMATLGDSSTHWDRFRDNYDHIRDCIEKVIPGFENYNTRVREPGGFYLLNPVKNRIFRTKSGKAEFTVNPLEPIQLKRGELLLQTLRSHDQFNTTIYGMDDRYRGIKNERRVLFMNPEDMKERGLKAEEPVDITSHFEGEQRVAKLFLVIPYSTPRGCVAAYFPEANVLVPIRAKADVSHTPISKSITVTVKSGCRS